MTLIKYSIPLLALILLVPFGMTNSLAQEIPGGLLDGTEDEIKEIKYTKEEISHAFITMEPYAEFDEDLQLSFDENAIEDKLVSELDIQIANDFASHSNEVVEIGLGPVAHVNEEQDFDDTLLQEALDDFRTGKFQSLFEENTDTPTLGVSSNTSLNNDVYFLSYYPIADHVPWYGEPYIGLLYCYGGFGYEHTVYNDDAKYSGKTIQTMIDEIREADFNQSHGWFDEVFWDKKSSSHPVSNCHDGAFRDEVKITVDYSYDFEPQEPNPNFWQYENYQIPVHWWPLYVYHWHDWNDTISEDDIEAPSWWMTPPL